MFNINYELLEMFMELAVEGTDDGEGAGGNAGADDGAGAEGAGDNSGEQDVPTYEIDGEQFTIEQIREFKQGHMRQNDYTKKTQELSNFRNENKEALELYNFIRENPEMAKKLAEFSQEGGAQSPRVSDPAIENIQTELMSMKLQTQLESIHAKDSDVDDIELLTICAERGCDANDAYNIWRGQNFDKILAKKLADNSVKITEEIKKNGIVTKTLASGGKIGEGASAANQLSPQELEYCAKTDTDPAEYLKWKQ